jgi:hypothetical protein
MVLLSFLMNIPHRSLSMQATTYFACDKISHVKNVLTIYYPYINYFKIINIRDNWKD